MALMTVATFGRKHVENATVVADTIFYAENMSNVASADQASYYRLLMTTGAGINKKDVFQDFYMNGNLRAEGGYSFIDLGNDRNTIFNGEVTTYYKNGKEKWHGKYVNGKRGDTSLSSSVKVAWLLFSSRMVSLFTITLW